MSRLRFAPRPVDTMQYNGVRLLGVLLRFPKDAPSGGEVMIQLLQDDHPVGRDIHFALEPGQPDALQGNPPQPFSEWITAVLNAKGYAPQVGEVTVESNQFGDGSQESGLGRFRPTGAPAGEETPLLRFS